MSAKRAFLVVVGVAAGVGVAAIVPGGLIFLPFLGPAGTLTTAGGVVFGGAGGAAGAAFGASEEAQATVKEKEYVQAKAEGTQAQIPFEEGLDALLVFTFVLTTCRNRTVLPKEHRSFVSAQAFQRWTGALLPDGIRRRANQILDRVPSLGEADAARTRLDNIEPGHWRIVCAQSKGLMRHFEICVDKLADQAEADVKHLAPELLWS